MDVNIVALLAVVVAAAAKLLWELYLSPLARQRIPGPKRAAASDLWHYWVQVRLRRTFTFHELFEVRVYSTHGLDAVLTERPALWPSRSGRA